MTKLTWNDQTEAQLLALVDGVTPVSQERVAEIAAELGTTARSIGAKLRKMEVAVDKATPRASTWAPEEEAQLRSFVEGNSGAMTYAEIAAAFNGGKYTSKQIQGKLLNMELFTHVKPTVKPATVRLYSEAEEARFVELVNGGASIEVLVAEFNRPVASIRGKALSLTRSGHIEKMPHQEVKTAKEAVDALAGLDIASMTVEAIAEKTGKTVRGIKSTLSRRGLKAADYDGAARREKLDNNKDA